MSTYIDRLGSHRHREYANVFEVLEFLQLDKIMSTMILHELNVMVDWDGNQQSEAELKEKNLIKLKC